MADRQKYPRVPDELVALVRDVVERRGVRAGARALGISHTTVAAILGGLAVQSGTIAILREAQRRREAA
jgi:hypothetical protein